MSLLSALLALQVIETHKTGVKEKTPGWNINSGKYSSRFRYDKNKGCDIFSGIKLPLCGHLIYNKLTVLRPASGSAEAVAQVSIYAWSFTEEPNRVEISTLRLYHGTRRR